MEIFEIPESAAGNRGYDRTYRRSYAWDYEKGDFVTDPAGRVAGCTGAEAYMTWCYKVAQTERYACRAYGTEIGVQMERVMLQDDERMAESMLQRTVTDALMVNPRTESVSGFEFVRTSDGLHCSFEVCGTGGNSFRVTV